MSESHGVSENKRAWSHNASSHGHGVEERKQAKNITTVPGGCLITCAWFLFSFISYSFFFPLQEAKGGNVFVEESQGSVLWHRKAQHRDACACGWGYLFFFARGCFFLSMDKDDPRYFPSLITQ
jgi:hypothetical protein